MGVFVNPRILKIGDQLIKFRILKKFRFLNIYLNSKSIQLLSFFLIMILFSHVFACLYYYITVIENTDNNWLIDNMEYIGKNNHYLGSLTSVFLLGHFDHLHCRLR